MTAIEQRRELRDTIEVRTFAVPGLEVRNGDPDTNQVVISGLASAYSKPYVVFDRYGSFEETFEPRAAAHLLNDDVPLLFNHTGAPLARVPAGNLILRETDEGLGFTATLDTRSPSAMDLAVNIQNRNVTGLFFIGMVVGRDEWNQQQTKRRIFQLSELLDVSCVTRPGNPATQVGVDRQSDIMATLAEIRQGRRDYRSTLSAADENALPDDAFAFVEPGGSLDSQGKTVPRRLRHFPIHDAAHVRNALARIGQGADFSEEAKPAVLAAARKFGIKVSEDGADRSGHPRRTTDDVRTELARIKFEAGHREGERLRTRIRTLRAPEGTAGADLDTTTTKSFPALHKPFSGTHVHSHSAYAQGDDSTHQHAHIHVGDDTHDHDHSLRSYMAAGTKLIGQGRQEANRNATA